MLNAALKEKNWIGYRSIFLASKFFSKRKPVHFHASFSSFIMNQNFVKNIKFKILFPNENLFKILQWVSQFAVGTLLAIHI